jgi:hypothetical protein
MGEIPRYEERLFQTGNELRTTIGCDGVPKQAIQVVQRGSIQVAVEVEESGVASAKQMLRSTMVRMWV